MTTPYVFVKSGRVVQIADGRIVVSQIDWQEDTLTWLIDGNAVRTLKRSDVTGTDGVSRYPSTPSRIELRYVRPPSSLFLRSLSFRFHPY